MPESVAESIATAIRALRLAKGLTQTAAGALPLSPGTSTISHWETGRKHPSTRLLVDYLESLGLDFHDLQDALDQVGQAGSTDGKIAAIAGQVEELSGQVDRLARVCSDLGSRIELEQRAADIRTRQSTARMDSIERVIEVASGRLAARLTTLDPDEGLANGLARLATWADSFGADIQRRLTALEQD